MIEYVNPSVEVKIPYWNTLDYVIKGWRGVESNINNVIAKEDGETAVEYAYRCDKLAYFDNFNPILAGINGVSILQPETISPRTSATA